MSIFFIGDPHGCFGEIIQAIREYRPEAVILLGDIAAEQPLHEVLHEIIEFTQTWWIHGNHDCDAENWYRNLFESQLSDRNLNARVVEIGGLRVAGLGGVFRGRYWHPDSAARWRTRAEFLKQAGKSNCWHGGLPLKARCTIWQEDYDHLAQLRADILVTHEAPGNHPYGFRIIDDLARSMGVSAIFHGHHHQDYHMEIDDGIMVRGVGFTGIVDQHGKTILPGAFGPVECDLSH